MSVLLIKGPPDDEVSAMMPLVTHSSPDETEGLIDAPENEEEEEEEEEDLELGHVIGSPRRSSTRVSQAELLENLKPGKNNNSSVLFKNVYCNRTTYVIMVCTLNTIKKEYLTFFKHILDVFIVQLGR